MTLGLRWLRRGAGFDRPKQPLDRPIEFNGAGCTGCITAQAGERAAVLCRPRPTLRPGKAARARERDGAGLRPDLGRATVPVLAQDQYFLFYFPVIAYFWKMKNSSKKIEKVFFPYG